MQHVLEAAQKRIRLAAETGPAVDEARRAGKKRFIAPLKTMALSVFLPQVLNRGDRYALSKLGPDINQQVFELLKESGRLTAETMQLFIHSHLFSLDLGGYYNTTQRFLDIACPNLSMTLTSLSLQDCDKPVDFAPIGACHNLDHLNLSGTKITTKQLVHLRSMTRLKSLRLATTKITELPPWLPQTIVELDVHATMLQDSCVGAVRRLTQLRALNVAETGIQTPLFGHLGRLRDLNLDGCSLLHSNALYFIGALTGLRSLHLGRCSSLPGGSLYQLSKMTRLQKLWLPPTIEAAHVKHLAPLQGLQSLSLRRMGLETVAFVKNLKCLESLDLGGNTTLSSLDGMPSDGTLQEIVLQGCVNLPDMALIPLARLGRLASLELSGCSLIGDKGAETLSKNCGGNLEHLGMQGCAISGFGLKLLVQGLPLLKTLDVRNTRVEWDDLADVDCAHIAHFRHDPNPAVVAENDEGDDEENEEEEG